MTAKSESPVYLSGVKINIVLVVDDSQQAVGEAGKASSQQRHQTILVQTPSAQVTVETGKPI